MANETKSRGTQLIRTDDSRTGTVRFYDRRQANAQQAFIAEIDVMLVVDGEGRTLAETELPPTHPIVAAACHGYTQNVLDSSNKLDGDARVQFVRQACGEIMRGGWASTPVDETKLRENTIQALMKIGKTRAIAEAIVNGTAKITAS